MENDYKIKTVLIGTPEFAENIFRKFYNALKNQFEIVGVITASDKPVGRKQILTPSPVKKWATENDLPIFQPDKIKSPKWIEKIKTIGPRLIILAAYGQIIPKEILEIPQYGALNIHPSLLPKYRGPSPIQTTILNGDKETGVTIILMDEEMDHGPIIQNSKFKIQNSKITHIELSKQLSDLGAELLIKALPDYIQKKIQPQEQNHRQASFCPIIKKEDGKIDWSKSADEIERMIRALNPWPGTYCEYKNQNENLKLKILEADTVNKKNPSTTIGAGYKIGEAFLDENKNLCVQTGNGALILKTIQLEGKKPATAKEFLNGHKEIVGAILQ